MTGNELITALKKCDLEDEVVFYYLKDDDLKPCKLETILNTEMGIELTIENIDYDIWDIAGQWLDEDRQDNPEKYK